MYFLYILLGVEQWGISAWRMPLCVVVPHCCNSFSNFCVTCQKEESFILENMILHSSHLSRKVSYILLIIVNGFCCSVASTRYLSITFHHSTVIPILRVWGTLNLHFHLPRWALLILGHYHYLTHRLLYQGSYAQIYCRSPQSHTSPWAWLWVHDITTALTGIVSHLWCLLNDQNYLPSFPLDGLLLCA